METEAVALKQELSKSRDAMIRFSDLINLDRLNNTSITLVGCGGIGSYVGRVISKLGFKKATLWDGDNVSIENIGVQGYRFPRDLCRNKAEALAEIMTEFSSNDMEVVVKPMMFDGSEVFDSEIVISGLDSMKARKLIWDKGVKRSSSVQLYIDGSMSALTLNVKTCLFSESTNIKRYSETLFDDEEGVRENCTSKATMFLPAAMEGIIGDLLKRYINREHVPFWTGLDFTNELNTFVIH